MTEAQARTRLQKLLAITLDRGASPGEQANATRLIGAILQEHPQLRDMIAAAGRRADTSYEPSESDETPAPGVFWKGVVVGIGATVATLGVVLLNTLFHGRGGAQD